VAHLRSPAGEAQARRLDAVLVSRDIVFDGYDVERLLA
jgi:hypothetical protein